MIGEHDHREIGLTNALSETINDIRMPILVIVANWRVVMQVYGVPLPVSRLGPPMQFRLKVSDSSHHCPPI